MNPSETETLELPTFVIDPNAAQAQHEHVREPSILRGLGKVASQLAGVTAMYSAMEYSDGLGGAIPDSLRLPVAAGVVAGIAANSLRKK